MLSIILSCFIITSTPFMPLSVATTDDALAVYSNPAGLGISHGFNLYYLHNFSNNESFWDKSTFVGQVGALGFAYSDLHDFRLSLGSKITEGVYFGTTFRKYSSKHFWDAGILYRPIRQLSLGTTVQSIGQKVNNHYVVGIGFRPWSNRYTLTCDASLDSANWKKPAFGLELEPINGIEIKAKINTKGDYSIQAGISLEKFGIGTIKTNFTIPWGGYVRLNSEKRRTFVRPPKRFLEMKLSGSIADQKPGFSLLGSSVNMTTYEVLNTIKKAKEDKSIIGLIIKIDEPSMGFGLAQEIKSALKDFKNSNKKLIIYASQLSNIGYYIASNADEIIIHPLGEVVIPGITARSMHLKRAMDKLGVEADYERVGKYKSAPEIFSEDTLSEPDREAINSMLDDYYEQITKTIAQDRNLSQLEVDSLINHGFFLASEAKASKLVNQLCYEDELDSILGKNYKGFRKITSLHYMNDKDYEYNWCDLPKIAIIYATGDITQGESGTDILMGGISCGANSIVTAIREARKDKNVKAIILRVDSPGGDGFASDLIWRELSIAKNTKPVIVSMGPVAASGGYYISMMADKIFASPATITGSIGVFSMKFITKELYSKLGINYETIKRGEHADAFSQDRKFTDDERALFQKQIQDFYYQFINKVAQGRHLTPEYVDSVGQGRVWTGNQAYQRKLVDSLGGLMNAIDYAKGEVKIKEVKLDFMPKPKTGLFNLTLNWIKTRIKNNF